MDQIKISLDIDCTVPGLLLTIKIDDRQCWQGDPHQAGTIEILADDQDGDHRFDLELSGKKPEHTKIDELGQITEDVLVEIKNFCLDEINIDQLTYTLAEYHHDFNGTQAATIDKFYGHMGCNGRATMRFTSPIYIWLLENI